MPPSDLRLDRLDMSPEEVKERFRWARRRGHPRYLWPEVPVAEWRAGLRLIERVTRATLTGSEHVPVLDAPDTTANALGVAAFTSGMGPLLGHWAARGRIDVPDAETADLLSLHLAHGRLRSERLVREAGAVLDILSELGATGTLLKGVDTARTLFPDPATRPSSDIDLLVEPEHVAELEAELERRGYRLSETAPRSNWVPPSSGAVPRSLYLTHAESPVSIDLHASLDRTPLGLATVCFGDVTASLATWPEFHPSACRLQEPLLTGFLALHASVTLSSATMIRLVELALAVRAGEASGALEWDALYRLLSSTGAMRFVLPAFELAEQLWPGTVDEGFRGAVARQSGRTMRRSIAGLAPHSVQLLERLSLRHRLLWVRGPFELARTLKETVWPSTIDSGTQLLRLYGERLWRIRHARVSIEGAEAD